MSSGAKIRYAKKVATVRGVIKPGRALVVRTKPEKTVMVRPKPEKGLVIGRITHVSPLGLGYLVKEKSNQQLAFTLDKVRGYRGQTLKKLGLRRGSKVRFQVVGNVVDTVDLLK